MKIIFTVLLLISTVVADVYYAKLEPVNSYIIKSSVSGKVIYTNEQIEGKNAKNDIIVKIDTKVDMIDLKQTQAKLEIMNSMVEVEQKNYRRLKKIKTKSDFEKDNQKIKVLNLQSSISDLITKIAILKDKIDKKTLSEKSGYIYSINVKTGDYVNPGSPLYELKDLSKGKLEFFIPIQKAKSYKNQTIFLDGKKTDLKIDKIYKVADSKHISSYKCEIIVNSPKVFSKLVKIEFSAIEH